MINKVDQNNISKVSKTDLINTFTVIDKKINNLHQRSSSDFLQLSEYLKDYHKKTRIVSENAFRILETIGGKKDLDLIKELGKIHQRLEDWREKILEDDSKKIQILKQVILESNQLQIALRNFKQDLTTFKFLSTNYSLLSNYGEFNIEWKECLEAWNREFQFINQSLTIIRNKIDDFKKLTASKIEHLENRVENALKVFHNLSKEIKANIGTVVLKSQESILKFPLLKEKTANSSKSISNIITHLQYHDIIRQKIEHIQTSHYLIIDDLKDSIKKDDDETVNVPDVYHKIGDVADLQAAQLLLVSKEYQNALNIITKNFQGIANDLTAISSISNEFSYKDSNSEFTLLKHIRNQLDEGIILLDINNLREKNAESNEAILKLNEISDKIKSNVYHQLNKLFRSDEPDAFKTGTTAPIQGVLLQIISLAKDIEFKNHDLNEKINVIKHLSASIDSFDDLGTWGNQFEQDRIELMVKISRILDSLDKDNEELDNVLTQNRELNNNILEKIENVINRVDYYEYFEDIVEQVINQLNSINYRLKPGYSQEINETKASNLNDIKNTYTMESERIVHEKVVSGLNGSGISDNPLSDKCEDEIEFF